MINNLTLVCTNEQGCQIEKESGVLQLTLSKNTPQTVVSWEIINQTAQNLRLEPLLLGDAGKIASLAAVEIKAGETQTTQWTFSADENWFNSQENRQLSFDYIWRIEEVITKNPEQNNQNKTDSTVGQVNEAAKPTGVNPVINYYTTNNNGHAYSVYSSSSKAKTASAVDNDQTSSVNDVAVAEKIPAKDVFTVKEAPLEVTGEVLGIATESPPAAAQSSAMKSSQMINMQTTGAKIAMIALLLLSLLLMAMFVWKRYRKSPK